MLSHEAIIGLRRVRDSNPRDPFGAYTLSRRAPSTTRPTLLGGIFFRDAKVRKSRLFSKPCFIKDQPGEKAGRHWLWSFGQRLPHSGSDPPPDGWRSVG